MWLLQFIFRYAAVVSVTYWRCLPKSPRIIGKNAYMALYLPQDDSHRGTHNRQEDLPVFECMRDSLSESFLSGTGEKRQPGDAQGGAAVCGRPAGPVV